MNIFVYTENRYLFYGIENAVAGKIKCRCVHLNKPSDYISRFKKFNTIDDVFIFAGNFHEVEFSLFLELNKVQASVIIATTDINWDIQSFFSLTAIGSIFTQNDLLQTIIFRNVIKSSLVCLPKVSCSEKKVLQLTLKGHDVYQIGRNLNITSKSVYSHRRNAFKKIGIRKIQDVKKFPVGYLNYLLTN